MGQRALCFAFVALCASACRTPATVVVVAVDTDVPAERAMRVDVQGSIPGSTVAPELRRLERGANGLQFPLSFGVKPLNESQRRGRAELRFDVELPGRAALDPTIRWTRRVRFPFNQGATSSVRVFLPLRCGERADGCGPSERDTCTVARLCEIANLTCGNNGECVPIDVDPTPWDVDASLFDRDASRIDATLGDATARDADSASDSASSDGSPSGDSAADASRDVSCIPNCTGRVCGADNCGGTCAPGCPSRPNTLPPSCSLAGQCNYLCAMGFENCNGTFADGCETPLGTSANCRSCGDVCGAGTPICSVTLGACVSTCGAPSTMCGASCVDTQSSTLHCGACGRACSYANADATCAAGTCSIRACRGTYLNCDGDAVNGCEADSNTDRNHCGSCGVTCGATEVCMGGRCTTMCPSGFADCNRLSADGCETNIQTDRDHCGGCGRDCAVSANCVAGSCTTCGAGLVACGGMCMPEIACPGACSTAIGADMACINVPQVCVSRCIGSSLQCVAQSMLNASCGAGAGRCNELGQCRCLSAPASCVLCGACGVCGSSCS